MKKKAILFSLILGLLVLLITPISVNAHWEDTNNHPVLTTEWDEFRVPAIQVTPTYDTYFIVEFEIPTININDKVLVFNKYSVIEHWWHFAINQSEIKFDYNGKPSVIQPIGYYINKHGMTESEKEDAYNRFFNSQFIFFTEDTTALSKITLTLWLDSEFFSKNPANYLEVDFYKDLVYLIPIEDLPTLNSFNLKSMKFYFKDYATWNGTGSYEFDFSSIPDAYDYFIFNFSNNVSRTLYYGSQLEYLLNINTDVGVRLVDRNNLKWKIRFTNSFDNEDNYFIAYDYNYIINLKDSLSRDILDSYNTGYDNGKAKGIQEGLGKGWRDGYDKGKIDGKIEGYKLGSEEGTTTDSILLSVFSSVGTILDIELLPNIKIGYFVLIPLVFGVVMFIVGKRGD